MIELDGKTYKYLKQLKKENDWVVRDDSNEFEIKLLYYYKLVDNESAATGRYRINELGKRTISEHCKKTIKSWTVLLGTTIGAAIGVMTLLFK